MQLLRRLWPRATHLAIDEALWEGIVTELRRRGLHGRRESGAFLLGFIQGRQRRVTAVAYFDDLDPDCLVGNIHFRARGYSRLWDICESEGLRVVGDVHTHPGEFVAQSQLDREHPMIAQAGHLAFILPYYGVRRFTPREVGVHEYHGDRGWRSWFGRDAERALKIRRG